MLSTPTVTALVLTYNEKDRVVKVVKVLLACPLITKLIVIDDGSDAESKQFLHQLRFVRTFATLSPATIPL